MRLSSASFSWAYFLLETAHMTLKNRKKSVFHKRVHCPLTVVKLWNF